MRFMNQAAKAIIGAATALGGTYAIAAMDGQLTSAEIVGIVVATIVGFFGVYAATNAPADK